MEEKNTYILNRQPPSLWPREKSGFFSLEGFKQRLEAIVKNHLDLMLFH